MTIFHTVGAGEIPNSNQNIQNGHYSGINLRALWKIPGGVIDMNVGDDVTTMTLGKSIITPVNAEASSGIIINPDGDFINVSINSNGVLVMGRHRFTKL